MGKTQRCACRKVGQHCNDCRCHGCTNFLSLRSEVKDHNTDGGGIWKVARCEGLAVAARPSAPPSPEATRKLLQGGETKENTEDGEGTTWDIPGYVPMGEYRGIKEVYGD